MTIIDAKELDDLNEKISKAKASPELMSSYAPAYFATLRKYIPTIMQSILIENDQEKCIELLQLIFLAQAELMTLKIMAGISIDVDLWEIAEDFDNNDPKTYDYLIRKNRSKDYSLQKSDN